MPDSHVQTAAQQETGEQSNTQQQVDKVSIKAPPFWKAEPRVWFIQLEAQFDLGGITQDTTKYNYVISAISTEVLTQVADFVTAPPAQNKYPELKKKLISLYSDSDEKRFRKLLSDMELGDRKPSQLLNEMVRLAGKSVSEQLLRTLWMARLPHQTQAVLTTSNDNLCNLAKMADKMAEIEQPRSYAVASAPRHQEYEEMTGVIHKLSLEVAELRTALSHASKPRRTRSRSRTPARLDRNSKHDDTCWYHRTFKEKASKCSAPCRYFTTHTTPQENFKPRQ